MSKFSKPKIYTDPSSHLTYPHAQPIVVSTVSAQYAASIFRTEVKMLQIVKALHRMLPRRTSRSSVDHRNRLTCTRIHMRWNPRYQWRSGRRPRSITYYAACSAIKKNNKNGPVERAIRVLFMAGAELFSFQKCVRIGVWVHPTTHTRGKK